MARGLSVRYKLLLLLCGTAVIFALSMAILFAVQLSSLHEEDSRTRIAAAFDLLVHDLKRRQDELMRNALAIAGQNDLIVSISMINTYQNPEDYQPLIFDVEKKGLADLLTRESAITAFDQIALYDAKGTLAAFCATSKERGCLSGYLTYENGKPAIEAFDGKGQRFAQPKLPEAVDMVYPHAIPETPRQTISANSSGFVLEAHAPLLRQYPDGKSTVIGVVAAYNTLSREFAQSVGERAKVQVAMFHSTFGSLQYDPEETLVDLPTVEGVETELSENQPHPKTWSQSAGHYIGASYLLLAGGGKAVVAMATHEKETAASLTAFRNAILLGFLLTILLIIPTAILFARKMFILPIENLVWKTKLVAEGRYDELKGFSGRDEFSELAFSINAMADNVRNRERQLQSTVDALARAKAEIERFAQLAAHDLKEPSRQIVLYAQLLERRHQERDKSGIDDCIGFVVNGAKKMQMMVDDLYQYTSVSREAPVFEAVDCQLACRQAIDNQKANIELNGAKISVQELPTVWGNGALIVLLFHHLIDNALKFRREDVPPEISISARLQEKNWIFVVQDNGIGIEQPYWARIFTIFTRLWTQERYPGTGLGLALCRRIVEQHGGHIWVESKQGAGSTFFFSLPVKADPDLKAPE